jgi:glycerol kinase
VRGGTTSILVVDVGTSSVRAAIVAPDATVGGMHRVALPPSVPFPGLVEFDPSATATAALDVARAALNSAGPVDAVGVTNQRASAVVWDARSGEPVGPGLGWQDLRTAGRCLELQAEGLRLAPNETATKVAWLLDTYDPDRRRDLRWGTIDSWLVWQLTGGALHVTDVTNAGVTGLLGRGATGWDMEKASQLAIPEASMPVVVDSSGLVGDATALEGAPPITCLVGDQQASLVGQGCTQPGLAKITFGTGAMLDVCLGGQRPGFDVRGPGGCFPIVAWRRAGVVSWGVEAIMLAAGSSVDWLVDDLGLLSSAAESEQVAAGCSDTGGVVVVPALLGLGTPAWDFGARGAVLGLSRGSGRAELVRAVLEGVAHRGADLLEAAEADAGRPVEALRVDGGMSANTVFVQALADACRRPVEVSPQLEATTLGAGFLGGLAVGTWADEDELAATWRPRSVVEPAGEADRDRWRAAVDRARGWYPELSALSF